MRLYLMFVTAVCVLFLMAYSFLNSNFIAVVQDMQRGNGCKA